jgi:hypothetical protein
MGFLARCLIASPPSTMGSRLYKEANLQEQQSTLVYTARLRSLLERPVHLKEGTNNLDPRSVPLEREAKQRWVAFHDEIERGLAPDHVYEPIRAFACKAAEHALRLAGVLATIQNMAVPAIPDDAMWAATTLMKYYLGEWLRLSGSSTASAEMVLAGRLIAWLRENEHRYIYLAQVYQKGPRGIRDRASATKMIGILETHHILTRVVGGREFDGVHRADVWEVHLVDDAEEDSTHG